MQITYENTFDHWVAAQLYEHEQRYVYYRKHDIKFIKIMSFMVAFNVCVLFLRGFDFIFILFTAALIVFCIFHHLLRRLPRIRKIVYHHFRNYYGQVFEEEKDKTVQWEATPEQVIIKDANGEFRLKLDKIRKIIVSPQYLFLGLGFGAYATLPKQAVTEGVYNAFCDYLINLYRTYAQQLQIEAKVIQSDWTLDKAALGSKAPADCSFKKVFFTVLWGILFSIAGVLVFGALAYAIDAYQISTGHLPYDEDNLMKIIAVGLMIGSALFGLTGLILGLLGKLPGTK